MNFLKRYRYVYIILIDYVRRNAAGFLFQFLIYRNLEVASISIAVSIAGIREFHLTFVICVVAIAQLLASLLVSDSYIKIVPYIRMIYLNKRIVPLYLLLNTIAPFSIYLIFFAVTMPGPQQVENFLLMTVLLFNNTLFAHFFHMYGFSIREAFIYLPFIIILYLAIIIQVNFIIIIIITITTTIFFFYKLQKY